MKSMNKGWLWRHVLQKRFWVMGMLWGGAVMLAMTGCAVPRYVWPQKDVAQQEINPPHFTNRVLIASRSSVFKDQLVTKIQKAITGEDVYVKLIGIDALTREEGEAYQAIVLINTCIAWGLDPDVVAFLETVHNHKKVFLLTTAGDVESVPPLEDQDIDAMSSASSIDETDAIVEKIVAHIKTLLL